MQGPEDQYEDLSLGSESNGKPFQHFEQKNGLSRMLACLLRTKCRWAREETGAQPWHCC